MRQQLKYTEISLNKENSEPLYLQLAGALRRQIGMTCLNSNERMISERRLSEQLGVDRDMDPEQNKIFNLKGLS